MSFPRSNYNNFLLVFITGINTQCSFSWKIPFCWTKPYWTKQVLLLQRIYVFEYDITTKSAWIMRAMGLMNAVHVIIAVEQSGESEYCYWIELRTINCSYNQLFGYNWICFTREHQHFFSQRPRPRQSD